jgi:transposase, IS30 family
MTNDNGMEFRRGKELENKLGIGVYYTKPASPWQRGTVENTNGLIRQYFAKGKNLEEFPTLLEEALEETLNHRPKKILGYRTPHEVFFRRRLSLMNSQSQLGLEFSAPF